MQGNGGTGCLGEDSVRWSGTEGQGDMDGASPVPTIGGKPGLNHDEFGLVMFLMYQGHLSGLSQLSRLFRLYHHSILCFYELTRSGQEWCIFLYVDE